LDEPNLIQLLDALDPGILRYGLVRLARFKGIFDVMRACAAKDDNIEQ